MTESPETTSGKAISILDGVSHWGLVLISFIAPLTFIKGIHDFADLPQSAFIQVGVVFLFCMWMARSCVRGECLIIKSLFNLPILSLILWCLVAVLYSHNRHEGLTVWMNWTAAAVVFFLVVNAGYGNRRITQLLTAVCLSGTLCSLLGLAQHFLGISWVPQAVPPAATFANKNMAAHFIILTLPITIGLLLTQEHRIWKRLFLSASILMIGFLVATKSRAAMVAIAAEGILLALLLVRNARSKTAFKLAALCLTVTIIMSSAAYKDFNVSSVQLRTAIWQNTLEMVKDKPWTGFGLGNHGIFYPLYQRTAIADTYFQETYRLNHVHNDFIQALAELGIVGALLLAWLGFTLTMTTVRVTSSLSSFQASSLSTGIVVGLFGLLIIACFSFPFRRAIPPFIFMLYTGILSSIHSENNRQSYAILSKRILSLACIIAVVGLAWLTRVHYFRIKSDYHFFHVIQLEKLKQWPQLVSEGKNALQYDPGRLKILSYVGRAYLAMGMHKKALESLQKLIAEYPNSSTDLTNLAIAYDETGDHRSALQTYNRILLMKSDHFQTHNNMANIYMEDRDFEKALHELKSAAHLNPQNSTVHFNIGMVEVLLKRYQEAGRSFAIAFRHEPKSGFAQTSSLENQRKQVINHLIGELNLKPSSNEDIQIRRLIVQMEQFGEPSDRGKQP